MLVIANLLFTGALLAMLAALTRSVLWVYIGVLGFVVLYVVSGTLLQDIDNVWLATLLEPLGMPAFSRTIRYRSTEQRNSGLEQIGGYLLANRALWLTVALALLAETLALFKTGRSGTSRPLFGRKAAAVPAAAALRASTHGVHAATVAPEISAGTAWRQFARQVRFDTVVVFRSVPFLVMLAFAMVNFVGSALMRESLYGTAIHPVTWQLLTA